MPLLAAGFTPASLITVHTSSHSDPRPQILTSGQLDGLGAFARVVMPPTFAEHDRNLESFDLIAEDRTNPAAPIIATTAFQVVRFGVTRSPAPRRPQQKVRYTARGFTPGRRVYAHFRFEGSTRRTVSLGVASGPCGITSRRMRALPTRARYGRWRVHVDQSQRFSVKTRPQWIDPFAITRRRR